MSDRFIQAKMKPAQAFSNLLDRLIRANETGLQAGKILVDVHELRKMRNDWQKFVDPKTIVMRETPCGGSLAQRILGEEVINLLNMSEYTATSEEEESDEKGSDSESHNNSRDSNDTTDSIKPIKSSEGSEGQNINKDEFLGMTHCPAVTLAEPQN